MKVTVETDEGVYTYEDVAEVTNGKGGNIILTWEDTEEYTESSIFGSKTKTREYVTDVVILSQREFNRVTVDVYPDSDNHSETMHEAVKQHDARTSEE